MFVYVYFNVAKLNLEAPKSDMAIIALLIIFCEYFQLCRKNQGKNYTNSMVCILKRNELKNKNKTKQFRE